MKISGYCNSDVDYLGRYLERFNSKYCKICLKWFRYIRFDQMHHRECHQYLAQGIIIIIVLHSFIFNSIYIYKKVCKIDQLNNLLGICEML